MDCPKCTGKLSKVEIKGYVSKQETITIEVDQCFVCNGIWFDAGELEKYLAAKMTILDSLPIDPNLIEDLDKMRAKCPRCQIDMVKKETPKDKDITVDYCEKCRGVWIDNSEINRIEDKNIDSKEKTLLTIAKLFPRFRFRLRF